jgi:hypothetical protein
MWRAIGLFFWGLAHIAIFSLAPMAGAIILFTHAAQTESLPDLSRRDIQYLTGSLHFLFFWIGFVLSARAILRKGPSQGRIPEWKMFFLAGGLALFGAVTRGLLPELPAVIGAFLTYAASCLIFAWCALWATDVARRACRAS